MIANTTKKIGAGALLGAFALSTLFIGTYAQAATPNWDVEGSYVVEMEYLGTDYTHDMNLTQNASGTLDGTGGSPAGSNVYMWDVTSGTVSGDTIEFYANYTATPDAVTPLTVMHVVGTIASSGAMSGTWTDNYQGGSRSGTWQTASGTAEYIATSTPSDTTPTAFSFTDQTGVATNTVIESNQITVSGINATTSLSVIGGEYSVNGGSYTSSTGTVMNSDTVKVRHTSASSTNTGVNTTLTIGGVSDTFTSTTTSGSGSDTTPNAFSFTDQTNVATNTVRESNEITVSGINATTSISVTGGEYSINGGSYTSSTGTVVSGDDVKVRHTSSATTSTSVNTVLTIGGVSDTFTSTTLSAPGSDTTPNAFSFTDQTNVPLNSVRESNQITVAGINATTAISVTGGEYSVNGGSYTASAGTVVSGDTVKVRHTSSSSNNTSVNTVLTIGGVSDTFTSTTLDDSTPPGNTPANKDECKNGGWMTFTNPSFKNQGQCVAYTNQH